MKSQSGTAIPMDKASGKLTVYFEEPFWIGVFERIEDGFAIIMQHLQTLQEERYLTENYGELYREYRKHVFRYLGRR